MKKLILLLLLPVYSIAQKNYGELVKQFMTGQNPGFQKENIVVVNADDVDGKKLYPSFKQAISSDPSIVGIAGADLGLGEGEELKRASLEYNGKPKDIYDYFVDPEYIPLMKMEIIRGRNFDNKIFKPKDKEAL